MAPAEVIGEGRPGTLTPEQEKKLKEMWAKLLELCGTNKGDLAVGGLPEPEKRPASPESTKKSGGGWFGRGKAAPEGPSGEGNDKYGQTQKYADALKAQTPEQIRECLWSMSKHDHPDALLLRFLRARKWDVQAAIVMLVSTLHWRAKEIHVDDDVMPKGEEHLILESTDGENAAKKKFAGDFVKQLHMGKSFVHGYDKEGRPCNYVRVRLHYARDQSPEALERFTVFTIESARLLLKPPVDTATIVFDMTSFSLSNMDYTPVKFIIKFFEANYPESLGAVLLYKAPWIFQGIWKIIRGWLDPVVAAKVHFANNETELEAYIPRDQMMKELGGKEDYVWKYHEPVEGENEKMKDTETRDKLLAQRKEIVNQYETSVKDWIKGNAKFDDRLPLAQKLADNYFELDPYVRQRNYMDRMGLITPSVDMSVFDVNSPVTNGASKTEEAPAAQNGTPVAAAS